MEVGGSLGIYSGFIWRVFFKSGNYRELLSLRGGRISNKVNLFGVFYGLD